MNAVRRANHWIPAVIEYKVHLSVSLTASCVVTPQIRTQIQNTAEGGNLISHAPICERIYTNIPR
jgi:hypothetical protein